MVKEPTNCRCKKHWFRLPEWTCTHQHTTMDGRSVVDQTLFPFGSCALAYLLIADSSKSRLGVLKLGFNGLDGLIMGQLVRCFCECWVTPVDLNLAPWSNLCHNNSSNPHSSSFLDLQSPGTWEQHQGLARESTNFAHNNIRLDVIVIPIPVAIAIPAVFCTFSPGTQECQFQQFFRPPVQVLIWVNLSLGHWLPFCELILCSRCLDFDGNRAAQR
jgi:hypothetical protein